MNARKCVLFDRPQKWCSLYTGKKYTRECVSVGRMCTFNSILIVAVVFVAVITTRFASLSGARDISTGPTVVAAPKQESRTNNHQKHSVAAAPFEHLPVCAHASPRDVIPLCSRWFLFVQFCTNLKT